MAFSFVVSTPRIRIPAYKFEVKWGSEFKIVVAPEVPLEMPCRQNPAKYVSPYLMRRLRSVEEYLAEKNFAQQEQFCENQEEEDQEDLEEFDEAA